MNECIGITHDQDVRSIQSSVKMDVLKRFREGKELSDAERPGIKPMILDYWGGPHSRWNEAVWEKFIPYFLQREAKLSSDPNYVEFPTEAYAKDLFMKRVGRLAGYVKALKPRKLPGGHKETKEQVKQRVLKGDEERRDNARDNTRRDEVRHIVVICLDQN